MLVPQIITHNKSNLQAVFVLLLFFQALWDTRSNECTNVLKHSFYVYSVTFADGAHLLSASADRNIRCVWCVSFQQGPSTRHDLASAQ